MRKWIFSFCVLLFALHSLNALDISITKKEVGFNYRGEYNRSSVYSQDFSFYGSIGLNDRWGIQTGIAPGSTGKEFDLKFYLSGSFAPFFGHNLYVNLAYVTYSIPGYEMHSHSFLPYVSYYGKWAGISLGVNMRITSFYNTPVFESMISVAGHVNFISNEKLVAGIKIANFIDNYAGNFNSLSLGVNGLYRIDNNWTVNADIELLQGGMDGLSTIFYGILFRGGVKYTW